MNDELIKKLYDLYSFGFKITKNGDLEPIYRDLKYIAEKYILDIFEEEEDTFFIFDKHYSDYYSIDFHIPFIEKDLETRRFDDIEEKIEYLYESMKKELKRVREYSALVASIVDFSKIQELLKKHDGLDYIIIENFKFADIYGKIDQFFPELKNEIIKRKDEDEYYSSRRLTIVYSDGLRDLIENIEKFLTDLEKKKKNALDQMMGDIKQDFHIDDS